MKERGNQSLTFSVKDQCWRVCFLSPPKTLRNCSLSHYLPRLLNMTVQECTARDFKLSHTHLNTLRPNREGLKFLPLSPSCPFPALSTSWGLRKTEHKVGVRENYRRNATWIANTKLSMDFTRHQNGLYEFIMENCFARWTASWGTQAMFLKTILCCDVLKTQITVDHFYEKNERWENNSRNIEVQTWGKLHNVQVMVTNYNPTTEWSCNHRSTSKSCLWLIHTLPKGSLLLIIKTKLCHAIRLVLQKSHYTPLFDISWHCRKTKLSFMPLVLHVFLFLP